jgi:hypothetical protein
MIHLTNRSTSSVELQKFTEWLVTNVGKLFRCKHGMYQGDGWLMIVTIDELKVYIDEPALEIMFKLACL